MSITSSNVIEILNRIDDVMNENKQFLTDLDAAIGDGDHGINIARGFNAVREKLKADTSNKVSDIFKVVGMTLVANVGGASGPLYGTAFLKASAAVQNKETIDINDFLAIIEAALGGIKYRGKAEAGEKTMLDALIPAANALKAGIDENKNPVDILFDAKEAAKSGVEYTKGIIATKGRASYLGDRSISHQDPGATSSYLILNVIYEEIKRLQQ